MIGTTPPLVKLPQPDTVFRLRGRRAAGQLSSVSGATGPTFPHVFLPEKDEQLAMMDGERKVGDASGLARQMVVRLTEFDDRRRAHGRGILERR